MMEKTWNYSTPPVSNVPAPYIEIVVYNPERSLKYPSKGTLNVIIDTGFDGYLITPINIFNELKLDDYEIPQELIETTETFTGEEKKGAKQKKKDEEEFDEKVFQRFNKLRELNGLSPIKKREDLDLAFSKVLTKLNEKIAKQAKTSKKAEQRINRSNYPENKKC